MNLPCSIWSALEGNGQVLRASSGPAALEVWSNHKHQIDLLLTDVVMPEGLSGVDLLRRLRAEAPTLPAILMSGYAATELSLTARDVFVQKPYRPLTLLRLIRESLSGGPVDAAGAAAEALDSGPVSLACAE
ncbi:MAG: response regulator [Verrucomicrobiota bacterium]